MESTRHTLRTRRPLQGAPLLTARECAAQGSHQSTAVAARSHRQSEDRRNPEGGLAR